MKAKPVPENFDDMDCPSPCSRCGDWYDLNDLVNRPSGRVESGGSLVCKKCAKQIERGKRERI